MLSNERDTLAEQRCRKALHAQLEKPVPGYRVTFHEGKERSNVVMFPLELPTLPASTIHARAFRGASANDARCFVRSWQTDESCSDLTHGVARAAAGYWVSGQLKHITAFQAASATPLKDPARPAHAYERGAHLGLRQLALAFDDHLELSDSDVPKGSWTQEHLPDGSERAVATLADDASAEAFRELLMKANQKHIADAREGRKHVAKPPAMFGYTPVVVRQIMACSYDDLPKRESLTIARKDATLELHWRNDELPACVAATRAENADRARRRGLAQKLIDAWLAGKKPNDEAIARVTSAWFVRKVHACSSDPRCR